MLDQLNRATEEEAIAALMRCCGCERWARDLIRQRPFADDAALCSAADDCWAHASREEILEAFTHHPRIGADLAALREKFASTRAWSAGEQSAIESADEATLLALKEANLAYEARYGHIFIVCATGKSAGEMLTLLQARMHHTSEDELKIAAAELAKITQIRLQKLLSTADH